MHGLSFITLKSFINIPIKNDTPSTSYTRKVEHQEKNYDIKVNKDSIFGSYHNDLNLIELNSCILTILDNTRKESLESLQRIKIEEEFKVKQPQFKIDRENSLKIIRDATEKISIYTDNRFKKKYIDETTPILDQYSKIGSIKKYVTFGKNIDYNDIDESIDKKLHRLGLIEDFLNIARKYLTISIYKKIIVKGCQVCGYDISKIPTSSDDELVVCPSCNVEITQLTKYKNSNESSFGKKLGGIYEGRVNFQKELSRYQGKLKNSKIPSNFNELLDTYFKQRGYPIGSEIKQNSELMNITNKDLMYKALKMVGLSSLYKDINLVCHLYWGWELVNLELLESKIMEKYDQINTVFESLKDNRSSAMNTQYELWWILSMIEYPCKPNEFKIPKTPEIFEYHEKKRAEICKILDWEYIPLTLNDI